MLPLVAVPPGAPQLPSTSARQHPQAPQSHPVPVPTSRQGRVGGQHDSKGGGQGGGELRRPAHGPANGLQPGAQVATAPAQTGERRTASISQKRKGSASRSQRRQRGVGGGAERKHPDRLDDARAGQVVGGRRLRAGGDTGTRLHRRSRTLHAPASGQRTAHHGTRRAPRPTCCAMAVRRGSSPSSAATMTTTSPLEARPTTDRRLRRRRSTNSSGSSSRVASAAAQCMGLSSGPRPAGRKYKKGNE